MEQKRPLIAIARPRDQYRYVVKPLPADSEAPVCEVCGESGPELYRQTEQRRYDKMPSSEGWTKENNLEAIGHLACLASLRRFTTNNTEYRTGYVVREDRGNGKLHTIEQVGLTFKIDEALIREITPTLIGHPPREFWVAMRDLQIVQGQNAQLRDSE